MTGDSSNTPSKGNTTWTAEEDLKLVMGILKVVNGGGFKISGWPAILEETGFSKPKVETRFAKIRNSYLAGKGDVLPAVVPRAGRKRKNTTAAAEGYDGGGNGESPKDTPVKKNKVKHEATEKTTIDSLDEDEV